MDTDFWHQKWASNELGFHLSEANPMLVKYFGELGLPVGSRVFLPLCGKTLDIAWLLSRGYQVAGAELSELAIKQLFEELGVMPQVSEVGKFKRFSAEHITVFVGDFFDLTADQLGAVDAIYDRAALVALPEEMRRQYTTHLMAITRQAPQLLISFDYDQQLMPGPPFSVSHAEVKQHYNNNYGLTRLASDDIPGGLKGICAAKENVWLLKSR